MNKELDKIEIIVERDFSNKRRRISKKLFNYDDLVNKSLSQ
jgi:hypothetical protein